MRHRRLLALAAVAAAGVVAVGLVVARLGGGGETVDSSPTSTRQTSGCHRVAASARSPRTALPYDDRHSTGRT